MGVTLKIHVLMIRRDLLVFVVIVLYTTYTVLNAELKQYRSSLSIHPYISLGKV